MPWYWQLYLASDRQPVDLQWYELCDLVLATGGLCFVREKPSNIWIHFLKSWRYSRWFLSIKKGGIFGSLSGVVVSNYVLCSPLATWQLGEDDPIWLIFFQMGWDHHLVILVLLWEEKYMDSRLPLSLPFMRLGPLHEVGEHSQVSQAMNIHMLHIVYTLYWSLWLYLLFALFLYYFELFWSVPVC